MFVYNFKVNTKNILKVFFIIAIIVSIIFFILSTYRIFTRSKEVKVQDDISNTHVANIQSENYTNVLKSVHDNLDNYIGQQIHFVGYIYRVSDIEDNQFILARDMIISSNLETLVVGFLCKSNRANEFEDRTWVELTGTITKGDYHGDIPVIDVSDIKKVNKPSDEYVYPPDSDYIPTSILF